MKQEKFSIRKRLKSFVYAFRGICVFVKEEHNARIHLIATAIVIVSGAFFGLNTYEWIAVLFCIGLIVTAEMINTAIENIADFMTKDNNESIKKIKDIAAGAVLISAITALVVGVIIFLPKIKI